MVIFNSKIIKDGEGIWQLDCFVSNRLRLKKYILKGLWGNTSALVCGLTHFHLEMRVWLPMILSFDLFRLEISSISQENLWLKNKFFQNSDTVIN